jgi:small-conductance mechanosensitive channel
MGESPRELPDAPALWVHARQYTGRIVRVTNDRVFDSPVYNLTREFPYLWEEMAVPISYKDDRARAESIILECVRRHVGEVEVRAREALEALGRRYPIAHAASVEPRIYWRLTDNWVELSARFVVDPRGVRGVKDAISRDLIAALDAAKIGIASATSEIVGLPPVRVELERAHEAPPAKAQQ